jgi:hypothetical protein
LRVESSSFAWHDLSQAARENLVPSWAAACRFAGFLDRKLCIWTLHSGTLMVSKVEEFISILILILFRWAPVACVVVSPCTFFHPVFFRHQPARYTMVSSSRIFLKSRQGTLSLACSVTDMFPKRHWILACLSGLLCQQSCRVLHQHWRVKTTFCVSCAKSRSWAHILDGLSFIMTHGRHCAFVQSTFRLWNASRCFFGLPVTQNWHKSL